MSLTLGKLMMNGGAVVGPATWHRIADLPFTPATSQRENPVAVMNIGGQYRIYVLRYTTNLWALWEYNPYLNTWTARHVLNNGNAIVNNYHYAVTVGTKLYLFVAQTGGIAGNMTVFVWDQPTDLWSSAAGGSSVNLPPGGTDMRWIRAVYLPNDPGFMRVWFYNNGVWYYYRWTIGTATFVQQTSGIPNTPNYLSGAWADTFNSPNPTLEQVTSGNAISEVYRRTWSATAPSARVQVDSPVSEMPSGSSPWDGSPETHAARIRYEYDQNPSAGVANVVANSWISDGSTDFPTTFVTIPSGLRVITPAGQTFWLGHDWALAGTSTLPTPTDGLPSPWESYLPALGFSETYAIPGAGLPSGKYGGGLRGSAIVYAAGCIFMFGTRFVSGVAGGVTGIGRANGQVAYALRYGDIGGDGGGLA